MNDGREPAMRWIVLRLVGAIAALSLGLVAILLSTSTTVYGFAVSGDPNLLAERGLQIAPLLSALATIGLVGILDGRVASAQRETRAASGATKWRAVVAAVLTNALGLAAVYTVTTVAVVGLVIGYLGGKALPAAMIGGVGGGGVDVVFVVVFLQVLHRVARRWYLTLFAFLSYAAAVVLLGSKIGSVELIGVATTPAIAIVGHDAWPVGLEAAWWGRLYWLFVTLALLAMLDRPTPSSIILAGALIAMAGLTGYALSLRKQAVAARYPAVADRLPAGIPPSARRPTLTGFDIGVDARLAERRIGIVGAARLRNDTTGPIGIVAFEKAQMLRLTGLTFPGARRWWTGRGGRMTLVELLHPLRPGESRIVRYQGLIDASDPFDMAARTLVMPHAFFLQTASLLPLPRRPACFAGPAGAAGCETGENYLLSDPAPGRVTVTAPDDLVVPAGRRSGSADGRTRSIVTVPPRNLSNMLISASRYRVARFEASATAPAITVYGAPFDDDPLDPIGRHAQGVFADYARLWGTTGLREFWIAETPPGLFEATAYGDGMAISERYFGRRMRRSDALSAATRMILAHEIAHQWWGYTLVPAKGAGTAFVLESLAQFAGLASLYRHGVVDRATLIAREQANVAAGIRRMGEPTTPLYAVRGMSWRAYHEGALALMRLDTRVGGALPERMGAVLHAPTIAGRARVEPAAVVDALIDRIPEQSRDANRRALARAR